LLPSVICAQALPIDRDSAWFKPSLVVDQVAVCADILRVEQDAFFSTARAANHERPGFKLIRKMYGDPVADPQVEVVPDSFGQLILTLPSQQRVVVYFHNGGGCGGACENEQVLVADKVFDPLPSRGHDLAATPFAAGWTLFKSADGEFYALGYPESNLQAYRITPSLRTELACEVKMRPGDADRDEAVNSALKSLQEFMTALAAMSQGAGHCGTLNAHQTRSNRASGAAWQTLYRPWGSRTWEHSPEGIINNSDSWSQTADAPDFHLYKWALSGVGEHRAFNRYRQQFGRTAADLSKFYQQKFGWSETQSDDAAARALLGVLDRGFAFSSGFDRFGREQALRQAILERESLEEIGELYRAHVRGAKPVDPYREASQYDSVLNAAIEYPEALKYLLAQGLDPNVTNGFGKTPLMYAAQYDQLESARILLEAGADPNAATFLPEDTCFYTLRSSGVTALHYAVRYSSVPLIQLLVANGAATFSKALRYESNPAEYPLDWIATYTERPRNAADRAALEELLRVPNDKEREQLSASFVTRAQAEYARGNFNSAYGHLRVALNAQPDNARALADLPLVAFKAGNISEALRAAMAGVESASSPQLQASAWFNMGLICESREIREGYYRSGACNRDWVWPFVQALKLQPTRGRADKLSQLFDRTDAGSCSPSGKSNDRKLLSTSAGLYEWDRVERFYILHPKAEKIDVELTPGLSRVMDAFPVGNHALTALEGPPRTAPPEINGERCRVPVRQ
jgi:hypothetical protein